MRSAEQLRQDIRNALTTGLQYNERDISISVASGRVTLRGLVHSQAEHIAVARAVKRVDGVEGVIDELVVAPGHGVPPTDREITEAAERALTKCLGVPAGQISVRVEEGQVTLDGHADDLRQRETVEEVIRHLAGVRRVLSHISTAPVGAKDPIGQRIDAGIPWAWRAELRDRAEHHEHGIPGAHHHTDSD